MNKSLKLQITEAVLKQLPNQNEPIDAIIRSWWVTMSGEGLRLTPVGDNKFKQADIESYTCPVKVTHGTWYSFVSQCSVKLKCPYFLGANKKEGSKPEPYIRLYDSKIAMLINLYGDIHSYLNSVKGRR